MNIYRWLPPIGGAVMGCVLALCGFKCWVNWQFWAIFVSGYLWCIAGYVYHASKGNRLAVEEAMQQLRSDLEKDTPRIMCLMVENPGMCSKEAQRHVWTLKKLELSPWRPEEEMTIIRTIGPSK